MKPKYDPEVYVALKAQGHSNRTIAALLGVGEASVRRGLKGATVPPPARPVSPRRFIVTVEAING